MRVSRTLCDLAGIFCNNVATRGQRGKREFASHEDLDKGSRRSFSLAFVEQQSTTDTQLTVRDVVQLGRTPRHGLLWSWITGTVYRR